MHPSYSNDVMDNGRVYNDSNLTKCSASTCNDDGN